LTPSGEWLTELSALTDPVARTQRLAAMQLEVRANGGCGSLQTANGLPCRRQPRVGYTVCRKHGERSPATMAKAERLLAVARMPAIEWVLDAFDQALEDTCPECGYPDGGMKHKKRMDSLAIKMFDRLGLGPRQTIDVNARRVDDDAGPTNFESWTIEERQQLAGLIREIKLLKETVRARLAVPVVQRLEGVTVQDDPESVLRQRLAQRVVATVIDVEVQKEPAE
jgi:hypothetical protein